MDTEKIFKRPLKKAFLDNILEEKYIADRKDCIFSSIWTFAICVILCIAVYFVGTYTIKLSTDRVLDYIYIICGVIFIYIAYRVCLVLMESDSLRNEDYYIVEAELIKISAGKRMRPCHITDLLHITMCKRREDSYYFKKYGRVSSERAYIGESSIKYSNNGDVFYLVIYKDSRIVGAAFNTKMYTTEGLII